jgi:hypothetical protein
MMCRRSGVDVKNRQAYAVMKARAQPHRYFDCRLSCLGRK